MGFLFHCKDEGSSQTSYRRNSFQGFSIRAGGSVPLPGGISALRCERGPHDPDADHLFARLFYTDRLDADMTLERLGFSGEEAALFAEIRMAMQGGVFIGGRAGDGKSTTLAVNLALQMSEMAGQLNLVTLEDPVEYRIPGAIQIAVPTAGAPARPAPSHFKPGADALLPGAPGVGHGLRDPRRRRGAPGAAVRRHRAPDLDHHPRPQRQRHPLPADRHGGWARPRWRSRATWRC